MKNIQREGKKLIAFNLKYRNDTFRLKKQSKWTIPILEKKMVDDTKRKHGIRNYLSK